MIGRLPENWYFGRRPPATVNGIDIQSGEKDGIRIDARGRARLAPGRTTGVWTSQVTAVAAGPAKVGWISQWTTPVIFTKHAGNPIYGPQHSSGWDDWTNGVSIIPCENNTRYRMYFCSKNNGIGFAEASLSDPVTWKEHPASPVLKPRTDNWEGGQINQPRVVKVTETHWRMYYTGWGFPGKGSTWTFGLAESFDSGITWKRVQDEPIMERGPAPSCDDGGVFVPSFLRFGDTWLMYYCAVMVAINGRLQVTMCLAQSQDGVHWEKYPNNPVLGDLFLDGSARSVTSRVYVRYDRGVFQIWYSFGKPGYRICYAESLDGIHWEQYEPAPVLEVSLAPAWDDDIVEYPEVQLVDNTWRLWFCGNGYGSVGYASAKPTASIAMEYRTGASGQPDAGWSGWQVVQDQQFVESKGFTQLRARLTQTDSSQPSPVLTSGIIIPLEKLSS